MSILINVNLDTNKCIDEFSKKINKLNIPKLEYMVKRLCRAKAEHKNGLKSPSSERDIELFNKMFEQVKAAKGHTNDDIFKFGKLNPTKF